MDEKQKRRRKYIPGAFSTWCGGPANRSIGYLMHMYILLWIREGEALFIKGKFDFFR